MSWLSWWEQVPEVEAAEAQRLDRRNLGGVDAPKLLGHGIITKASILEFTNTHHQSAFFFLGEAGSGEASAPFLDFFFLGWSSLPSSLMP